jgi:hypothetical protein
VSGGSLFLSLSLSLSLPFPPSAPEVNDGLLEEGDEDGLGVRELGHQLDLDAQQALLGFICFFKGRVVPCMGFIYFRRGGG